MEQAIIPAATLVISLATFAFTNWRTQTMENRSATRDTVDLLSRQSEGYAREIKDLREQMEACSAEIVDLKRRVADCETARIALVEKLTLFTPPSGAQRD